ncbi:MAG: hypothetical protein WCC30_15980 [Candidatus Dormiibacterota bacterium]
MKVIRTAALAGAFVAATLFGAVPALAAPMPITAAAPSPPCTGYVTANPSYQADPVNTSAPVTVYWYCEAATHVVANINWGDNNFDNYTCWLNCSTGSTRFDHTYVKRGYFYPSIYMTAGGSGGTSVEIYVY